MSAHRLRSVAAAACYCGVAAAFLVSCSGVSTEELARRIQNSTPTWQSYSEDIKGQVGAAPVAEWEGQISEIRLVGGAVQATFRLSGPWAQRDVAIPVLLREPFGGTCRSTAARRDGDLVTYIIELPEAARGEALPWVELKFPHGQRRLPLSEEGLWPQP